MQNAKAALVMLLLMSTGAWGAMPFLEMNGGIARQSENLQSNAVYELRGGALLTKNLGVSVGFLNDAERETASNPDRLLPGDLSLRTLDLGIHLIKTYGRLSLATIGNVGYTFTDERVSKRASLADLNHYDGEEELISVKETVNNGISYCIGGRIGYLISDRTSVTIGAQYFIMQTERNRTVVTYDENSPAAYNDRYYTYLTSNSVNLSHWVFTVGLQIKLF